MQVLDGLIMDAWRCTSGFPSLGEFARSKPTPEQPPEAWVYNRWQFCKPWTNGPAGQSTDDCIHQNTRLTASGPSVRCCSIRAHLQQWLSGELEILLVPLTMIFRGAGSNNYCMEILHLILNSNTSGRWNLRELSIFSIWCDISQADSEIVCDNMITNVSVSRARHGLTWMLRHGINARRHCLRQRDFIQCGGPSGRISQHVSYSLKSSKRQTCAALVLHIKDRHIMR